MTGFVRDPRSRLRALALLAAASLAAACDRAPSWPPSAVEVDLGRDACASCRMIVSERRFAAQYHDRSGTVEHFDDLGCLLDLHGGDGADAEAAWVRSFDDAAWLRADEAYVVRSRSIASPMGFGYAAFANEQAAAVSAAAHGAAQIVSFSSLLSDRTDAQGDPR